MNNHWGTNYRAYQEGIVEFRYALRPHAGHDLAAASRLAIGLSQPLLALAAPAGSPTDSLFRIDPPDVLAIAFKPSEDGKAWILRLFGVSAADRKARIQWAKSSAAKSSPQMWLSDLSELPLTPLDQEIAVPALDLVTVRIERD
jgi:alpha-mannosidase